MPYSSFTTEDLKEKFGVEQIFRDRLFANIPPRAESEWLRDTLAKSVRFALSQKSEKARSEFIIAPVFLELHEQSGERISVFSGIKFDVDKKQKLDGWCDFLVSRSPYQAVLEAPVVVAIEAKRQDFEQGTNQCIAEMIAARIFNERRQVKAEEIYGCVTTGDVWKFLLLRGDKALIDTTSLDVREDLSRILGILWAMAFDEVPH